MICGTIYSIMLCVVPLSGLCSVICGTVNSIMSCDNMWYHLQHYIVWYVVPLSGLCCVIRGTVNSIMSCDNMWYHLQHYIVWYVVPLSALCFLICGTVTNVVFCDYMFHKQTAVLMVYIKVKISPVLFLMANLVQPKHINLFLNIPLCCCNLITLKTIQTLIIITATITFTKIRCKFQINSSGEAATAHVYKYFCKSFAL